jgi:hypothetical protein
VWRTEAGGDGGPACGGAAKAAAVDGGVSPVHASSWAKNGCRCASFAIGYATTSTYTSRARYSCKYEYDYLSLYVHT